MCAAGAGDRGAWEWGQKCMGMGTEVHMGMRVAHTQMHALTHARTHTRMHMHTHLAEGCYRVAMVATRARCFNDLLQSHLHMQARQLQCACMRARRVDKSVCVCILRACARVRA